MTDLLTRQTTDGVQVRGKITRTVHHDPAAWFEDWAELTHDERFAACQSRDADPRSIATQTSLSLRRAGELVARDPPPVDSRETTNTTVDPLHELIAKILNPNATASDSTVGGLTLGTDGASGTSSTDTSLNTRVGVIQLSLIETPTNADDPKNLETHAFLDTTQLNGNTLDELGLKADTTASSRLFNHATFADIDKTNQKAVTFDVTIQFRSQ